MRARRAKGARLCFVVGTSLTHRPLALALIALPLIIFTLASRFALRASRFALCALHRASHVTSRSALCCACFMQTRAPGSRRHLRCKSVVSATEFFVMHDGTWSSSSPSQKERIAQHANPGLLFSPIRLSGFPQNAIKRNQATLLVSVFGQAMRILFPDWAIRQDGSVPRPTLSGPGCR